MTKLSRLVFFFLLAALVGGVAVQGAFAKDVMKLRTRLAGDAIDGVVPQGQAEWRMTDNQGNRFNVQVEDIHFPDGTMLDVSACGFSELGTIVLKDSEGHLDLREVKGDTVPICIEGDTVSVMNGVATILLGTF